MQPGKNGFHVNPTTHKVGPCNAGKKPCQYGGESGTENHYKTSGEANAAAERMNEEASKEAVKLTKKKTTKDFSTSDGVPLSALTDPKLDKRVRGDVLAFEAMKRNGRMNLGKVVTDYDERENVYGMDFHASSEFTYEQGGVLTPDENVQLKEFMKDNPIKYSSRVGKHAATRGSSVKEMLAAGYQLDYIPNSMHEVEDDLFDQTDAPNKYHSFINSKAVLTNPNGEKMVVNVSTTSSYDDLVPKTLEIMDEVLSKNSQRDKKVLSEDIKKRAEDQDEKLYSLNGGYDDYPYGDDDDDW